MMALLLLIILLKISLSTQYGPRLKKIVGERHDVHVYKYDFESMKSDEEDLLSSHLREERHSKLFISLTFDQPLYFTFCNSSNACESSPLQNNYLNERLSQSMILSCNQSEFLLHTVQRMLRSDEGEIFVSFHDPLPAISTHAKKEVHSNQQPSFSSRSNKGVKGGSNSLKLYVDNELSALSGNFPFESCNIEFTNKIAFLEQGAGKTEVTSFFISNSAGHSLNNNNISLKDVLFMNRENTLHILNKDHVDCENIMEEISLIEDSFDYGMKEKDVMMLEADSLLKAGSILSIILTPVMKAIMTPIIQVFVGIAGPEVVDSLTEDVEHNLNAQTPLDISVMLTQALTSNVSNLVSDALTAGLTASLTNVISQQLNGSLTSTVSDAIIPRLSNSVSKVLKESIPPRVLDILPDKLASTLSYSLTQTLTQSVTHAIVPTVTKALSYSDEQEIICSSCFNEGNGCDACKFTPQADYYNNYYSTYYSDYYGAYYSTYYSQAQGNIQNKTRTFNFDDHP